MKPAMKRCLGRTEMHVRRSAPVLLLLCAAATAEVAAAGNPRPEDFPAVVTRPLFRPDRRAPEEPATPAAAVTRATHAPPAIRFVGTLRRAGRLLALVSDPEDPDRLRRLGLGEEIAGWRVVGLDADRLTLERDGDRVHYRLAIRRNGP